MILQKRPHRIFFASLLAVVGIITFFSFNNKDELRKRDFVSQRQPVLITDWELSDHTVKMEGDSIAIERTFTKEDYRGALQQCLFFKCRNVKVYAEIDGKEVYHYDLNGTSFVGNQTGNVVHSVNLPPSDKTPFKVYIEFYRSFAAPDFLEPYYESHNMNIITPKIFIGGKSETITRYLASVLLPAIGSVVVIALGVIGLLICISVLLFAKEYLRGLYYFSIFSLVMGIGFLFESGILDTDCSNPFYLYFGSTLILSVLPVLYGLFADATKLIPANEKVTKIFGIISAVNAIIVCLAAVTSFFPFSYIRHYIIIFQIFYQFFMITIALTETVNFGQEIKVHSVCHTICSIAMIVDLVFNIVPPGQDDLFVFTRPCLILFIVTIVYELVTRFHDDAVLSARKQVFKEIILNDQLTATRSRVAFWQQAKEMAVDPAGKITLALCEVLNLKELNAGFGFDSGDLSLKITADLLKSSFDEKRVFRFDGTGFAVISEQESVEKVCSKFEEIKKNIAQYNNSSVAGEIILNYAVESWDKESDGEFDKFVARTNIILRSEREKIDR